MASAKQSIVPWQCHSCGVPVGSPERSHLGSQLGWKLCSTISLTVFLCVSPLLLAACSMTTLHSATYNPRTGHHETTVYSGTFVGEQEIAEGHAAIHVVGTARKRAEPITYTFLQWIGGLGPGDLYARADVDLTVLNKTDMPQTIKLSDIAVHIAEGGTAPISLKEKVVHLPPRGIQVIRLANQEIGSYETAFYVKLTVANGSGPTPITIKAHRQIRQVMRTATDQKMDRLWKEERASGTAGSLEGHTGTEKNGR